MPNIQKAARTYSYMQNPGSSTSGQTLDKGKQNQDKTGRPFKDVLKEEVSKRRN